MLWRGAVVACIASGPSLTQAQCDYLRGKCHAIAVCGSWRMAPWADLLYAWDYQWWKRYRHEVRSDFAGKLLTVNHEAHREFGIDEIHGRRGDGLPDENGIRLGCDSGYQSIQLAVLWGAAKVLLVGYDQQNTGGQTHWHGDHKPPLANTDNFKSVRVRSYETLAAALKGRQPEVVNCSLATSLRCFRRSTVEAELR